MSDDNKIKFTYGEVKAQLSNDNKKLEYENDKGNKLRQGLQNIFNAIKKLEGDNKTVDSEQETQLLNKLQSIFQAGSSNSIDDDELTWAKGFAAGGDVVNFIDTKYNEVVGTKQSQQGIKEQEGVQEQQSVQSRVNYNNPIIITETPEEISSFEEDYTEVPGFEDDVYMVKQDVYIPNIDNDYCLGFITDTPEKAKEYKQQFDTELAKIKYIAEVSDAEWEQAYAQNMQAIENIAALANYDKNTLLAIIDKYITNDDYVDPKSPEYNSFVQRLLDTRNAEVIQKLDLLVDNRKYNIENDVFRGNEDTFKALVTLYKEVRYKERRGEPLNDDEKELKAYFKNYEVECGYRYNEDLRMVYDGNGDFRYQGKPYSFYDGSWTGTDDGLYGISIIAGKSQELVTNFQKDYRAAGKAINDAKEEEKANVEKAQYRALFKKYADNTDDSFACSVLTSKLIKYADMEDLEKAINANGVEYLHYLKNALGDDFNETQINDIRKLMVERAITLFTHDEKGVVGNMLHINAMMDLINNTTFADDENEDARIALEKKETIIDSYFHRSEEGKLNYTERRMTADEVNYLCKALADVGDEQRIIALMEAYGNEPEVREAVIKVLGDFEYLPDEIRISLIKDYMVENEDGTYSVNKEAYGDLYADTMFKALPFDKIDITTEDPDELSGNEIEYRKIWNAVFEWADFNDSTENWWYLKNSLAVPASKEPVYDSETGEPVIDPETGEAKTEWLYDTSNILEFDRMFFEKLQNNLTADNTKKAMEILKYIKVNEHATEEPNLIQELKKQTAKKALNNLANNPTKKNIDDTVKILESLKPDTDLSSEAETVVDAAIKELQNNPDAETLRSLVKFCQKLAPDTTYNIMLELDISDCKDDIKKAMQTVMFESYISLMEEPVVGDDVIKNGWMTKTKTITSYNKGRTISASKNMYRMGDHELEFDDSNKLKQRSVKGIQAGLDILDGIKGWNTANGPQHRKAREELDNIDKDSVVDTILAFNEASSNYSDGTTIMEYLDGEKRGMTVEYMKKVPLALIEWGKENNKDTTGLENLVKNIGNDADNSFPKGIAKQLDDAMLALIAS